MPCPVMQEELPCCCCIPVKVAIWILTVLEVLDCLTSLNSLLTGFQILSGTRNIIGASENLAATFEKTDDFDTETYEKVQQSA